MSNKNNSQKSKKIIRIAVVLLIIAALAFALAKGFIQVGEDGKIMLGPRYAYQNTVNTAEPSGPSNTAGPAQPENTVNTANTARPENTVNTTRPENTANTAEPQLPSNTVNAAELDPEGPVYYTKEDLKDLTGTEIFNSTAIEHIFLGNVNSSKKGSGYHYDMIEDSPGEIVKGTRSKEDANGIYTADVKVSGYKKDGYSSFFPDDWSPQQVVDAIAEARQDALKTKKMKGNYHVGYSDGIRIEMYFDSKDRVVTAYPVRNGK